MTLLLNNDDVERALTPEDAVAATEQIYRELAQGTATIQPRRRIRLKAGSFQTMMDRFRQ